jgi:predicted DNA-binding ribbon-helix-helix protein
MVKIEVEIPQNDYDVLAEVAEKIGLTVQKLIQQEIDEDLTNISAWMERCAMLT